jgi:hypothetical protein
MQIPPPLPRETSARLRLLSVGPGRAVERVAIGMAQGNAELVTAVEGFLVTDRG